MVIPEIKYILNGLDRLCLYIYTFLCVVIIIQEKEAISLRGCVSSWEGVGRGDIGGVGERKRKDICNQIFINFFN